MNAPQTFKLPKPKACKICRVRFQPTRMIQPCCSYECEVKKAEKHLVTLGQRRLKESRRETRQKKLAAKTRQQWLKEVQVEFNKYIRLRDKSLPCISCQRFHSGQYHAGHYRTVGAIPALRFNELNVHKQCSACNNHKSGNVVEYRLNLVKKCGEAQVEWLEGPHDPQHYTIEQLVELKALYKRKIKEIENVLIV